MTTDNFCFYLQNRLIQTSQTGGQQYSDTSPFSIPWFVHANSYMKTQHFLVQIVLYKIVDTKKPSSSNWNQSYEEILY